MKILSCCLAAKCMTMGKPRQKHQHISSRGVRGLGGTLQQAVSNFLGQLLLDMHLQQMTDAAQECFGHFGVCPLFWTFHTFVSTQWNGKKAIFEVYLEMLQ